MNNGILFLDTFRRQNTTQACVLWIVFNLKRNFTDFTVDDSGKIQTKINISLLFKKHYAKFRIKWRANYANVKENFITQVNLVY